MFLYNFFIFISLAPPVPVVEDRNFMQCHGICMTSFVTSKVQTTIMSFFQHVLYNYKGSFKDNGGKNN